MISILFFLALTCAGYSHNWKCKGRFDLLSRARSYADAGRATSLFFLFGCSVCSAFVSEADIMLLVLQKGGAGGVAFAAEIVVGVLGNVTCFIALAEERP